jgi:hypothetical protein
MRIFFVLIICCLALASQAQPAEELVRNVRAKLDRVNDYQAKGRMKTNVVFIKAPVAQIIVYYKKPNRLRIKNESGISFVPKGSINISLNSIFLNNGEVDIIDAGKEPGTNNRIIKLLPRNDEAEIVLSTLYIDETSSLVRKVKTTTRENGSYELDLTYGKYAAYGLADKVVFSFNTKDYKLPKGVTFDYDNGGKKADANEKLKNKKGKVEIVYSSYIINRGVADSVFD